METTKKPVVSGASPLPTGIRIAVRGMIILSIICYLVSFGLPAIDMGQGPTVRGYQAFVCGLFALLIGCPAVIANPLLWSGFFALGRRKWQIALVLGILATILAICSLTIYDPGPSGLYHGSEYADRITVLHSGFWCWLASFVLFTSGCTVQIIATETRTLREHQVPEDRGA